MTKHIRYVLRGLYEITILVVLAGFITGVLCGGVWLAAEGYWIPVVIVAILAISWIWGYLKEPYNKYT